MFGWINNKDEMTFRTAETSGAYDGGLEAATHGLMATTRVASTLGWRGVESLAKGDMVLTFDNGMKEIIDIRRVSVDLDAATADPALWPVIVPEEAMGNKDQLTLLPDQGVMLECDAASDIHGDPFAIVTASALTGLRGIHRARPVKRIELISISFAEDQVIYAEGGALIFCPALTTSLARLVEGDTSEYQVLPLKDAAFLVECLELEDQVLANGGWTNPAGAEMGAHL